MACKERRRSRRGSLSQAARMAEQRSGCLVTCACKTLTAERHKRAGHALLSRAAMRKPLLTNALLCELEKDRHHSQHSGPPTHAWC
jgi:hypothetical protein